MNASASDHLRAVAVMQALAIGTAMADELEGLADDIDESSGDPMDARYLRELVSRWQNTMKILQPSTEHPA